jgi:signal transduction histidine kinase
MQTKMQKKTVKKSRCDNSRQMEEDLVKLREQGRLRDSLMRMMVHDMRSPLMCIMGSLELIRHEWEADRVLSLELWQMSVVAAQEVIGLCTSLLDVSQMEDGQMPIKAERCELLPSIDKAVTATQLQADFHGVTVRMEGEVALVFADHALLHRMLVNLLNNAIKCTPRSGEIVVRTACSGRAVRVEIQDSGRGIPPEFHKKIFEKFGQVESTEGQKYTSGLGLAFCKLAVEAQGGRIGVDSRPVKGSTFWFTLPVAGDLP